LIQDHPKKKAQGYADLDASAVLKALEAAANYSREKDKI